MDDDGSVHLYAGQAPLFAQQVKRDYQRHFRDTAYHVELEKDMVTLRTEPKRLIPNIADSRGTGFEGHEMFAANSIRKFNDRYYFIYSSSRSHELCWAVSDRPDGGFEYGGVLTSNGDIGLKGDAGFGMFNARADLSIMDYIGNNHGSVEKIGDKYYVFGHRQTNRHMYSRQGYAEEIVMTEDGRFLMAERTSCGLNGGPLRGVGKYEARIACNLQSAKGALFSTHPLVQNHKHPAFTQDGEDREDRPDQHIANMRNGAKAGFKYFDFSADRPGSITVSVRGKAKGELKVYDAYENGNLLASVPIDIKEKKVWTDHAAPFSAEKAVRPLFFVYEGKGAVDFLSFELK